MVIQNISNYQSIILLLISLLLRTLRQIIFYCKWFLGDCLVDFNRLLILRLHSTMLIKILRRKLSFKQNCFLYQFVIQGVFDIFGAHLVLAILLLITGISRRIIQGLFVALVLWAFALRDVVVHQVGIPSIYHSSMGYDTPVIRFLILIVICLLVW